MPPNQPMARGRAAIEAHFKQSFNGFTNLKLTPMESAISGSQASGGHGQSQRPTACRRSE